MTVLSLLLTQVAGYKKEKKKRERNQEMGKPIIPKRKEPFALLGLVSKKEIQL
jgi:hypothetical protein